VTCPDCIKAKKAAYSDATTPGFFRPYCERHDPLRGGRPDVPTCTFCSQPATCGCTEPIVSPWIAFPGDLKRYALIQDSDLQWVMVEGVEIPLEMQQPDWESNPEIPSVKVWVKKKRQVVIRSMRPLLPLLELRSVPCGLPVCDVHVREMDDEKYQCFAHWNPEAPKVEEDHTWAGLLETSIEAQKIAVVPISSGRKRRAR